MLAVLVAAAVLGDVELVENGCDIDGFTTRKVVVDQPVLHYCCRPSHPVTRCYGVSDVTFSVCNVAKGTFQCCYSAYGGSACRNIPTQKECSALVITGLDGVERREMTTWCGDTPADSDDLDTATVGTIIVASFIGVTLIGGAIAVYQSSS